MNIAARGAPYASLATAVAACCLIAATSEAQPAPGFVPAPLGVSALLNSTAAQDQAWGAWLAGQLRLFDLSVPLEGLLERSIDSDEPDARDVVAATLDALIELNAAPAAAVVARVYQK